MIGFQQLSMIGQTTIQSLQWFGQGSLTERHPGCCIGRVSMKQVSQIVDSQIRVHSNEGLFLL